MAIEPPSNTDKHREWHYKQITGFKIIEGAVLELIHNWLAALSKPHNCIKNLLNLI